MANLKLVEMIGKDEAVKILQTAHEIDLTLSIGMTKVFEGG